MFGKQMPGNVTSSPRPALREPAKTAAPTQGTLPKTKASKEKIEQFNTLKMRLHRKLIDQLDLARMTSDDDSLREQVKELVSRLADQENTLLNFNERQRLIDEVLDVRARAPGSHPC
jgi:pilus assembly protein CpaF